MKKIILILTIFLTVNTIFIEKSIGQCSDLSIDTMYYDTNMSQISGEIKNIGNWYVIYPFINISVDSNSYISSNNQIVPSYLDSVGGSNNGLTYFFFQSTLHMPFGSIPMNTTISGTITITDPNDTSAVCVLPFQWYIKSGTLSTTITEYRTNQELSVYPNPLSSDNLTINLNDNTLIQVEIYNSSGQIVMQHVLDYSSGYQIDMSGLDEGAYFIRVFTDQGWTKTKIIKM